MRELPLGWQWKTLAEVLVPQSNKKLVQQGWSPRCRPEPASEDEWGVLKTTAIQAGRFDDAHHKALPDHLVPRAAIEVMPGDLLITCAGPRARCGVPSLVRRTRPKLMMSGKMYRFRPTDEVDADYLEAWLLGPEAQRAIDKMKTGISDSGLNLTHGRFLELPVPVPPVLEQHRIVEVLDDHLSRLDAGNKAISVSQRRAKNLTAAAVSLVTSHDEVLTLGHLAVGSGYGTSTKCSHDGNGMPVARIPNVVDGRIDMMDEKRAIDEAVDLTGYSLRRGDLLVIRTNGSRDLIGRSAVVDRDMQVAFASYLIRFSLDSERVRSEWVQLTLSSPRLRTSIERMAASSAGQYNLSLKKLNELPIPCPPLAIQDLLLERFTSHKELVDRGLGLASAAAIRSENLRTSLLEAAFSGRLTGSVYA